MNLSLYNYSLCITLTLILFFGLDMLFARVPEKKNFSNFLLSRRMMGVALLILAANYSAHFFFGLRLKVLNVTILVNMTTYFLCYWLFSSALMTLLVENYVTRRRTVLHLSLWLAYSALAAAEFLLPVGIRVWATRVLAAVLVIYGLFLAIRLLRTYRRAIRLFENTHSDDIGAYIRWLSIFTYWAAAFGISCALLTFLPDKYVFLWVFAAAPFYIYLYVSYQNYMLFYETVECAIESDPGSDLPATETFSCNPEMQRLVQEWVEAEGYLKPGLTIADLSKTLYTNRTYLSAFINQTYKITFREWICGMRIGYAKRALLENPDRSIAEIAEKSGFLSVSNFNASFKEREGMTPTKWRISNLSVRQKNADLTK